MNSPDNKLSVVFAGDICISQKINKDFCSNELTSLIKKHDYRIANWEAPIIKDTHKKNIKTGPHIHQDNSYKYFIKKELFNVFSLANNHITDYGSDGLKNTINKLSDYKLTGVGFDFNSIYKPLILNKNGISIGLIAACESQFGCIKENHNISGGYAWIFSNIIIKNIIELKNKVDFIIILPHAGLEMENLPLPEWRNLYKTFIDYGADLVVASHAHVIQPKETYQGKSIYYCLGNFFFNTNIKNQNWFNSLILSCEFVKNNNQKEIIINEFFTNSENSYLNFADDKIKTHFSKLNNIFEDEEKYMSTIEDICVKYWYKYHKGYYGYTLKKLIMKYVPGFIKKIISSIIHKPITNDNINVMLYHNIAIETNRFVVERALKKINKIL